MASQEEKFNRQRLRSSYLSVVVSIALVLFMLGLVGMILLNAKKLSDHVKENISITLFLGEDAKEADILKLQKQLDASAFVRTTAFIDKDMAAERLEKDLGEDFIGFLGYNPLLSSIEVYLLADYANNDSIAKLEADLMQHPEIREIAYQKSLVQLVNENVRKISIILIAFSSLLLLIAVALINNSIRLAIYSKRFLIKSMQLVGATQGFIRRPFVYRGIANGTMGAVIAIGLLASLIYYVRNAMPELLELQDGKMLLTLFGIVLLLGVLITWISTFFAVRKFLKLRSDQLYY